MKHETSQVFTVEQVGKLLGIGPAAVRRLLALGQLPGRKVGKRWRILRAAFEQHLSAFESRVPEAAMTGGRR